MPPVVVTDPDDDRLADYLRLTDMVLRTRLEPEHGLFMAEGETVVRRALGAGHRPRSLLLSPRWVEPLAALAEEFVRLGAPVYVAQEPVVRALTGFRMHRGVMAAMHRPPLRTVPDVVAGARRIAVLEDVVDHTNVGAVFRSAAALGVDAVLVTPRCADPLYRRSVRVSMGTVFQVPWTRLDVWPGGVGTLRDSGFTIAALALGEGATSLDDLAVQPPERLALVLGTEGDGLSASTVASADLAVRIPMAGGVDSLNVAAASAVAFWATRVPAGLP